MQRYRHLLLVLALLGSGCASPPLEVVEPPLREAGLYPGAQSRHGLVVAVSELSDPEAVQRYFGAPLHEQDILPLVITVSNHTEHTYRLTPASIVLWRESRVVDPLPLQWVTEAAARSTWGWSGEVREQFEQYYRRIAVAETTVNPGQDYRGVMFFPARRERESDFVFRALSLFGGGPAAYLVLSHFDTGEAQRFGPFYVAR